MVSPSQCNNSNMQELMPSHIECSSTLGHAYAPYLTKIICGNVCVALWALESLYIWYIWGPNIYLLVLTSAGTYFFILLEEIFLFVFFRSKTQYSSSPSSSGLDVTIALIYRTPPASSFDDRENFVKQNFVGSQGCGDIRLIFEHSCSYLLEGVCVCVSKYSSCIYCDIHSKLPIFSYNIQRNFWHLVILNLSPIIT